MKTQYYTDMYFEILERGSNFFFTGGHIDTDKHHLTLIR